MLLYLDFNLICHEYFEIKQNNMVLRIGTFFLLELVLPTLLCYMYWT